jgi:hypothetical protein
MYTYYYNSMVAQLVETLRYKPKVAGSIPDGVTSGRTIALGLTQPLTEMCTKE